MSCESPIRLESPFKVDLFNHLYEHSFEYDEDEGFELSSGQKSSYYIDCKNTMLTSFGHLAIGDCFSDAINYYLSGDPVDAVAGVELGGYPIIGPTILQMRKKQQAQPCGLYVRKEKKKHGKSKFIEGIDLIDTRRSSVVIVEDVITTGNSVINAVSRLKNEGINVQAVFSLIDREENGIQNIQTFYQNIEVYSFFTISQFVDMENT